MELPTTVPRSTQAEAELAARDLREVMDEIMEVGEREVVVALVGQEVMVILAQAR